MKKHAPEYWERRREREKVRGARRRGRKARALFKRRNVYVNITAPENAR